MPDQSAELIRLREKMVSQQIKERGIHDPAILDAMRHVPRDLFVSEPYRLHAYDDTPLPIPNKQTISQPYVVALMIDALRLTQMDTVLEIGTGSGYAAALLGLIVKEVHTVERHEELVDYAQERLKILGIENVFVHHGDGTLGWPANAPYQGIVVAAGGPDVPLSLREQLAVNGRLVIPVGQSERRQHLFCLYREDERDYRKTDMGAVAFVPLIGKEGWKQGSD